ncbi:hypothetical protein [Leisingera aquaemixtae]|uniref:DUF2214 domain-containing protein n=1 Tax=Leisingera aquaemixtae TaxID=1396826 RepID=A0A0P1H986_9RHOB|nr:hypothetical protein [Leisingera aquaemixtae]CUH99619.1 hypothetical protein PHA8399_01741 [Leisingera aquaemixtae]
MPLSSLPSLFLDDPAETARTGLRFLHFIGLAAGLGSATLLDLLLLRFFLQGQVSAERVAIFEFASKVVDAGLKLLWLTGFGFLLHYALTDPVKLENPKVHAKLLVVAVLTLNGVFIHAVVLPHLRRQAGRPLFEGMGHKQRTLFAASGAVSAVSWYLPVALGAFPQLNFTLPATQILTCYLLLIALMTAVAAAVAGLLSKRAGLQAGQAAGRAEAQTGWQAEGQGPADLAPVSRKSP